MRKKKLRLAVLISGAGRTLRNFLDRIEAGTLPAEIPIVISSDATAAGLQFAEEEDSTDIEVVERARYENLRAFSDANFEICRRNHVDYVVLAGYLKYLEIPKDFENRVLNIHPSLIPSFCGRGFYGNIVHAKALEYGVKISGCTVHFVDQDYDSGPIILQRAVEVLEDDTPDSLNDRIFEAECEAYPEAIRLLAEGRVSVQGRIVKIIPDDWSKGNKIDF